MFIGYTRAKTTSTNHKKMWILFAHEFWGCLWHYRNQMSAINSQNKNIPFPLAEQHQKQISGHERMMRQHKKMWGKHTTCSRFMREEKQPLKTPKSGITTAHSINHTKKWNPQLWRNEENNPNHEGECPSYIQLHEEENAWVNNGLGMHFQSFICPRSQKSVFPKMGDFPNSNLTSIPFPSQGNNFLHQL